jgi:serine/threonine-protein kinase
MLADHHRARLVLAEEERDTDGAVRAEALLRLHDRGKHAAFLGGRAALTLVTEPPGAEVSLYRYTESERVLVPEYAGELGRTPLREVALTKGSYLLKVRAAGYHEMTYPVFVGRGEHWSGVAPGEQDSRCIRMLREGELEADSVYVPAGWFIAGGDPRAAESLPRMRLWCEGMVVKRYPVTNRQYLEFLNDLVLSGQEDVAIGRCPRRGFGLNYGPLYARDADGQFVLGQSRVPSAEELEWPVAFVDWHSVVHYAAWWSEKTGRRWRLLNELEWEKAARGVDGRSLPWGDHVDPAFACMLGSEVEEPTRVPVTRYPVDQSPYGVRGMAGNVRDWCSNAWTSDGPEVRGGVVQVHQGAAQDAELRSARGGTWVTAPVFCRLAARFGDKPSWRFGGVGFRLARSVGAG